MLGTGHSIDYFIAVLTIAFGVLAADPATAGDADAKEYQSRLAGFDAALLNGIHMSGRLTSSATTKKGITFDFTIDSDRCAVKETRDCPDFPERPNGNDALTEVQYEPDGSALVTSEDRTVHLFHSEKSARMKTFIRYNISPANEIVSQEDMFNQVQLYPHDDITLVLPKLRLLWCSGRGFSPFIDEIVEISGDQSAAIVELKAKGRSMTQMFGMWQLEVEPACGMLVRKATFIRNGEDSGSIEIATTGRKADSSLPLPENGSFSLAVGGRMVTYSVTFVSAEEVFNEALYDAVSAVFSGETPIRTNFHDRRSSPEKYHYVDANGKVSGPEFIKASQSGKESISSRTKFIVLVNIVVLIAFALLSLLRRRNLRKDSKS